jgi:hypothetical protein
MIIRFLATGAIVCGFAAMEGCSSGMDDDAPQDAPSSPGPISFGYDFASGDGSGWQAVFSDFAPAQAPTMELESGVRSLPPELGPGAAYFVQSNNHSDDAFMLLYRRVGAAEGLVPGAGYRVKLAIVIASDAPRGCSGVGGAPGEGVTLKIGAVSHEPHVVLATEGGEHFQVDLDKGNQAVGGADMSVAGNVANNAGPEECASHTFHAFSRVHEHATPVTATASGDLWLLVGTDSGFEGTTQLYYQRIDVTLTPAT